MTFSKNKKSRKAIGLVLAVMLICGCFLLGACSSSRGPNGYLYKSSELGFEASFPEKPKESTETVNSEKNGAYERVNVYSETESAVTYAMVSFSNKIAGFHHFLSLEQYKEYAWIDFWGRFKPLLEKYDLPFDYTRIEILGVSSGDGYRMRTAIEPIVVTSEDGSEEVVAYVYGLMLATESELYEVYGLRDTRELAVEAIDSFKLI